MKMKHIPLFIFSLSLCVSCSGGPTSYTSSEKEVETSNTLESDISETIDSNVSSHEILSVSTSGESYSKEYFFPYNGDFPTNMGMNVSFDVEEFESNGYVFFLHKGTLNDYSLPECQKIESEMINVSDRGLDCTATGYYLMGVEKHSDSQSAELVIPDYVNDVPVLGISYPARADMTDYDLNVSYDGFAEIKKIVLPSSLQYLCDGAFFQFCSLEEVEFNSSLSFLPFGTCYGLKKLKLSSLPESITSIYGAFWFSGIDEFTGSSGLKDIHRAFQSCQELKTVDLSHCCIADCDYTFAGCENLETVLLPNDLKRVGFAMFSGCESLEEITVPEGCEEIDEGFTECSKLSKVSLPKTIKSITTRAFVGDTNLSSLTFDGTIEEWGNVTIKYQENYGPGFTDSSIQEVHCTDGIVPMSSQN